jgi:membrane fusion protein (multidrug efflux system)
LDDAEVRRLSIGAGSARPESRLRRWRWPLIIGGPVVILAAAVAVVLLNQHTESTDDAYVDVGKAPVSASVAGRVTDIYVRENQVVRKGQPLFRLDARPLAAEVQEAAAKLAQAELQVRALRAAYQEQQANLQGARDAAAYTAGEAERRRKMLAAGVSSEQELAAARNDASQARRQLAAAQQQANLALANLNGDPGLPVERHPEVMEAKAGLERAQLTQSYGVVVAPADGIVTRVDQLQIGGYVKEAQTVFWLLSGQPWIEANFKENQLGSMRVGQPVTIKVDAYPQGKLKGHVASFSPGSGQAFSALPAQNATGNWVKVVQRLPVRIVFDRQPPPMAGRAGLSAHVEVDVASGAEAPS